MASSKIPKQNKKNNKIPQSLLEVTETPRPSVCFYHLNDSVASLTDVSKDWLIQMMRQFKVLGGINWADIAKYGGLGWDKVPQHSMKYKIPDGLKRDHLYHIKISGKSRVWGYREGDAFHLVWLDPEHKVTPE